ncbi:MAG: hypothetical protein RLZZ293_1075 [Pseudomonadota bacterium]
MQNNIRALNILTDLVAYPSITPEDAGSLAYIEQIVNNLGGDCVYVNRNQTKNLIATLGSGNTILAFAGHVDVVPTGQLDKWDNGNPFLVKQTADGTLIGRGVADMKGAIAAFLTALEQFCQSYESNQYKIMLLLTSDEEGNAVDGTTIMVDYLQQHNIQLNYCVVGEPSCVNVIGDTIKVGRRGSLSGELTIIGKQGHIAYPHLCINPIHLFAPVLNQLLAIQWDHGNQFFPATSLQFANLNAGLGTSNVIPGQLTATFNFRYNNLHSAEQLQHQVVQILDQAKLSYQLKWNHSAKPFLTKLGNLVNYCQEAIDQVCHQKAKCKTDGGTSDGRFLITVSDEIIEFGLRNNTIHQINEMTTVEDLTKLTNIYFILLSKIFND